MRFSDLLIISNELCNLEDLMTKQSCNYNKSKRKDIYKNIGNLIGIITPESVENGIVECPKWLKSKLSWQVIKKENSTIIVSDGFSDFLDYRGESNQKIGIEFLGETQDEIEEIYGSWFFNMVYTVSIEITKQSNFIKLINELGIVSFELSHIPGFESFYNQNSPICFMVGIANPNIPNSVKFPHCVIKVITIKLLTQEEHSVILKNGENGRQKLNELFALLGSYHFSSLHRKSVDFNTKTQPYYLKIIRKGIKTWNKWRVDHPQINPNLTGITLEYPRFKNADFSYTDLRKSWLSWADLTHADLRHARLNDIFLVGAKLAGANLQNADFTSANLSGTDFTNANLKNANLRNIHAPNANFNSANLLNANFRYANCLEVNFSNTNLTNANFKDSSLKGVNFENSNLTSANFSSANLTNSNLSNCKLIQTILQSSILINSNLSNSILKKCLIHGISVWDINLNETIQEDLFINDQSREATITVDNLEVAQFIYLLLNNEKIRDVIDTIGKKAVLILGRFTQERKAVLDALRNALRCRNYLPILFDFNKPSTKDYTETVSTLAHIAKFIIADLTDPSSIPKELEAIVPTLAVPVQPILMRNKPYSMFQDYWKYYWVLKEYRYKNLPKLLESLDSRVIAPAEKMAEELAEKRKAALK